jgi:hypothetical protein
VGSVPSHTDLPVRQLRIPFASASGTLLSNLLLLLLLLLLLPAGLPAQIEYRNLDDGHPATTEDAYPVERYAFELSAPYRFEAEAGGAELHLLVPELVHGVAGNTGIGVKLPLAAVAEETDTDWGLAGLHIFGLFNFTTETPRLPALSLRADVSVPVGGLAGDDARVALKAIATRSWGRTRVHLNATRGFGSEDALSAVEPIQRWSASLAIDRTLFRSSMLLVGEVATEQAVSGARLAVDASVGARWQWTPTLVLDAGVTRRLRNVGPDIALTVGLSHAFALPVFMPGVRR